MKKIKFVILFSLLAISSIAFAEKMDVNDVLIEGDSTLMGMRIESVYFANDAFLIETTGARFEYFAGELKLYQGLEKNTRRLLSTITFDNEPNFIKVESNDDHIIFWSKDLNIGIYGDSTLIISPKVKQDLKCNGNFKPDYEGRFKGELLLIDDLGGMEIYPQRYETGYEIKKIELGKIDWNADYQLNAGERVMVAAFPGRPFGWEKSFNSHIVFTRGKTGNYGKMPSDITLRKCASNFDIIVLWWRGLYINPDPSGPYIIANESEFERLLLTAHKNKIKIVVYTSFYYHYHRYQNIEFFFEQITQLRDKFGIDGIYIDGLLFDHMGGQLRDNIVNWEVARKVKQLFGANGIIIYHGTNARNEMTTTTPNIDTYCDATLMGEKVPFNSISDPYIQYQVKKHGISNTIGLWKRGPHPKSITEKDIIEAIISMNGQERVWSPLSGKYEHSESYVYYRTCLEELKERDRTDGNGKDEH